jgi:hypothetical protein
MRRASSSGLMLPLPLVLRVITWTGLYLGVNAG